MITTAQIMEVKFQAFAALEEALEKALDAGGEVEDADLTEWRDLDGLALLMQAQSDPVKRHLLATSPHYCGCGGDSRCENRLCIAGDWYK